MLVTQVYKAVQFVTICAGVAAFIALGPILQAAGVIGA